MADLAINTNYLRTNRGVIKILQIVFGLIVCSLLCANWYGRYSCFGEGRLGFCSGLNFVIVIINIVFFILNFINLNLLKIERIYSVVACILFLVASILIIWYLIQVHNADARLIATTVLIILIFLLFLWDVKILQGEASNF